MRKFIFYSVISALILLSIQERLFAFADAKGKQNCSKCHTLSKEEAKNIIDSFLPNVKILIISQSPVTGMWEIGIDKDGRKAILYLDYSKKHVISPATGGNLISIDTRTNLTQESFQKISKVDPSKIPLEDALVMGEKTAKYKIIVFDDPD